MKSKLLSIDNIFEEVRDRVVWIKFKHLNMPEDKPKLNQYLKRLILEHGLKEPIYIHSEKSGLEVSDGYNRLMCLEDIITDIDEVEIPCVISTDRDDIGIKKRQKELYKMDIDKFRGGRAIPDLQVKSFWKNIDADELSNVITNNTTSIGLANGATILKNIWEYEAPSTLAASSRDIGIVSINPFINHELNPIDPPK